MKKYTQKELNEILKLHKMWLKKEEGGKRANLSEADLFGANLFGANLSEADLSGANLSRANLSRANLSGTNLSGANLYEADLFGANLSGANLSRANLYEANLSKTLYENKAKIEFQFQQHLAFYFGLDEITIGCQKHSVKHWLDNYAQIGKEQAYSADQIEKYGAWIKYIDKLHFGKVEE